MVAKLLIPMESRLRTDTGVERDEDLTYMLEHAVPVFLPHSHKPHFSAYIEITINPTGSFYTL